MANQKDQSGSKDQKNQQKPDQQKPAGSSNKNQKPGQQGGRNQ